MTRSSTAHVLRLMSSMITGSTCVQSCTRDLRDEESLKGRSHDVCVRRAKFSTDLVR